MLKLWRKPLISGNEMHKKKDYYKEKRKQESVRQKLSYSAATTSKGNQAQYTHIHNTPNITKQDTLKIHMFCTYPL